MTFRFYEKGSHLVYIFGAWHTQPLFVPHISPVCNSGKTALSFDYANENLPPDLLAGKAGVANY